MAYTTIDDPSAYFKVQLYTGSGDAQSITFDDTDTNMQPDLIWQKSRSASQDSRIFDAVRGGSKLLYTSIDNDEETDAQHITAFGSDGFTMGTAGSNANDDGTTYVAWCWKESATAGFDIVSYTGDGSNRTISHSLSAVPNFAMIKERSEDRSWVVTNTVLGWTGRAFLDATDAWGANSGEFNDTTPTSSVFTLGTDHRTNKDTETYVAYLWAEKQGFSKFGKYTGNGSATDGTFIYLGFKPAFFLIKRTDASQAWMQFDNTRDPSNLTDSYLYPDTNEAEGTSSTLGVDFLSNGIKIRSAYGSTNTSGSPYMYAAFAESPFVNSNGVPNNAR